MDIPYSMDIPCLLVVVLKGGLARAGSAHTKDRAKKDGLGWTGKSEADEPEERDHACGSPPSRDTR
eukprot:1780534-Pleurochrysis_carterae.AAC.1